MSIRGIGVDTVDVQRFADHLTRTPKLLERLFAAEERNVTVPSLAARFAAKEALIKALGGSWALGWHDLVILRDAERAPTFKSTRGLTRALAARGAAHPHVSMTHDAGVATAFVVLEAESVADSPDPERLE